jgi:hypothetical protein
VLMLAITGGRERTEKEYRELLSRALRIRRSSSYGWSAEHPHSKVARNGLGVAQFLRLFRY